MLSNSEENISESPEGSHSDENNSNEEGRFNENDHTNMNGYSSENGYYFKELESTPLHIACTLHNGSEDDLNDEEIKRLLDNGANPNAQNTDGQTPLCVYLESTCLAKQSPSLKIIKLFVEKGVDLKNIDNSEDSDKKTALEHVCANPNISYEIVKYLIEKDSELISDKEDDKEYSCLNGMLNTCKSIDVLLKLVLTDSIKIKKPEAIKNNVLDKEDWQVFLTLVKQLNGCSALNLVIEYGLAIVPRNFKALSQPSKDQIYTSALCFFRLPKIPKFLQFKIFNLAINERSDEKLIKSCIEKLDATSIFQLAKDIILYAEKGINHKRQLEENDQNEGDIPKTKRIFMVN